MSLSSCREGLGGSCGVDETIHVLQRLCGWQGGIRLWLSPRAGIEPFKQTSHEACFSLTLIPPILVENGVSQVRRGKETRAGSQGKAQGKRDDAEPAQRGGGLGEGWVEEYVTAEPLGLCQAHLSAGGCEFLGVFLKDVGLGGGSGDQTVDSSSVLMWTRPTQPHLAKGKK